MSPTSYCDCRCCCSCFVLSSAVVACVSTPPPVVAAVAGSMAKAIKHVKVSILSFTTPSIRCCSICFCYYPIYYLDIPARPKSRRSGIIELTLLFPTDTGTCLSLLSRIGFSPLFARRSSSKLFLSRSALSTMNVQVVFFGQKARTELRPKSRDLPQGVVQRAY